MTKTSVSGSQLSLLKQLSLTLLMSATIGIATSGMAHASVSGSSTEPSNNSAPQATCPAGGQCFADVPSSNSFYTFVNRIFQQDLVTGYACGGPNEPCDAQSRPYYRPGATVTRQQMAKFIDNARRLPEIHIDVASGSAPIYAKNNTGSAIAAYSTSGQALTAISSSQSAIYAQTGQAAAVTGYSTGQDTGSYGVYGSGNTGVRGVGSFSGLEGESGAGFGVRGITNDGYGVYGEALHGRGVMGLTEDGIAGVQGVATASDGIFGSSTTGNGVHGVTLGSGRAGYFEGNVEVTGTCCAMAQGTTRIDHPLDPANKTLNQSLVASPDMLEIFRGHVTLDAMGTAVVQLPSYFEALTTDYDYQLTPIGAPMPNLYVAQEVQGNTFRIAGGKPNTKVSWQVTGVRNDPYAASHPIDVEQSKATDEQGTYLHPELYGQPAKKNAVSNK